MPVLLMDRDIATAAAMEAATVRRMGMGMDTDTDPDTGPDMDLVMVQGTALAGMDLVPAIGTAKAFTRQCRCRYLCLSLFP